MPDPTTHVLSSPPPLRALAMAAGTAVLGAVLLVLADSQGWPIVVAVLGGFLLVAAAALAVAGLVVVRLSRVEFRFDDQGYRISARRGSIDGQWEHVQQVTTSLDGHRITLVGEPDQQIGSPAPASDPRAKAMFTDLKQRLDNNRGYRPLD